jgi:hypothetical protein
MADLTDVEDHLVNAVSAAIYPNSTANPSVAGIDAMVYVGYPVPPQLDADLDPANPNPRAHITVNFLMDRDVSNILNGWQTVNINPPTLILTVNETAGTITVAGTVSTPQNCAIKVNSVTYHYAVQQNDTLQTIAANIAAIIPNATASLTVITIPNVYQLIARLGKTGQSINAVGQEQAIFRKAFSRAIQNYLNTNYRFNLPDTTGANISYKNSTQFDTYQKTIIYRRDLMYQVTYYTTLTSDYYTITDTPVNITNAPYID